MIFTFYQYHFLRCFAYHLIFIYHIVFWVFFYNNYKIVLEAAYLMLKYSVEYRIKTKP